MAVHTTAAREVAQPGELGVRLIVWEMTDTEPFVTFTVIDWVAGEMKLGCRAASAVAGALGTVTTNETRLFAYAVGDDTAGSVGAVMPDDPCPAHAASRHSVKTTKIARKYGIDEA